MKMKTFDLFPKRTMDKDFHLHPPFFFLFWFVKEIYQEEPEDPMDKDIKSP